MFNKKKYMREYYKKHYKEIYKKREEYLKEYYKNNKQRYSLHSKINYVKNRNKRLSQNKNQRKIRKVELKKYKDEYDKNNIFYRIVKQKTHDKFNKEKQCEICGETNNLSFHHWVYKLPIERKHFSTLCIDCHRIQHMSSKTFYFMFIKEGENNGQHPNNVLLDSSKISQRYRNTCLL